MLLKEALPKQKTPVAGELVSPPPIFDVDQAKRAVWVVETGFGNDFKNFPALRLALVLSCYNFIVFEKSQDYQRLFRRLNLLWENELAASQPANPFPTIGIEVEVPTKAYNHVSDFSFYAKFFDSIGMPRNRINKDVDNANHWEFSPPPSFTGAVQNRILCELIKGRFIPSLLNSKDPRDIKQYLDDKLVSLHVNLGIPPGVVADYSFADNPEVRVFASMLALGFSSPERLQYRSQTDFVFLNSGEKTTKGGGRNGRLQVKALEVNTQMTYRLLREAQLVSVALFAYLGKDNLPLAAKWDQARGEILSVFAEFGFEPSLLKQKEAVAILVSSTSIGQKVREVVDRLAKEVARLILPRPQPPEDPRLLG